MARPRSATARRRIVAAAQTVARRAGYELRYRDFYQPFPDIDRLPDSLWHEARATPGVDFDLDAAAALIAQLEPYFAEFAQTRFDLGNGSYDWGDADILYGLLRHLKPARLIELGSGASSHVIASAKAANAMDGSSLEFESFDPYPGWHAMGRVPGVVTHPIRAEDIDPQRLSGLRAGDVLFVDTTHTVKTGGDVNHIFLDLLPSLDPGVFVHVHDVFLPYEYPRAWVVEERRAWGEQYLLQALLAYSSRFQVVLPVHALWRQRRAMMHEMIPSLAALQGSGPGAFWMRTL